MSLSLSPGLDTPRHTSTHLDTGLDTGLDTLDTPFPDSMLRRCRGYSLDTLDTLDTLDSGSTALDSTSTVLSPRSQFLIFPTSIEF